MSSSSSSNNNHDRRLSIPALLSLVLPSATLFGAIATYFITDAIGWDAVFPSFATAEIVWKLTVWSSLITLVSHEQWYYWCGGCDSARACRFSATKTRPQSLVELEVQIDDENSIVMDREGGIKGASSCSLSQIMNRSYEPVEYNNIDILPKTSIQENQSGVEVCTSSSRSIPRPNSPTEDATPASTSIVSKDTPPFRFIRATKGDIEAAKQRWADTLKWREELGMDTILNEPHPNLALIKENYPHYFHCRGKKNECCYYEKPPKMNLKVLRAAGIQLDDLLRHYALCCEYMWCKIDPSDDAKSIYVIDLDGMGLRDFAGEVVDFVKKASAFTGSHFPERSGSIFVINVPSWFSIIWNVVRTLVDEVTKEKITILKVGKKQIAEALQEKIPIENIPEEYGGTSMALGSSPEEKQFINYFIMMGERQQEQANQS